MKTSILLIAMCVANAVAAQQVESRQDIQNILSSKVSHYAVNATNLLQAFAQIASDFNVPLGVEWQGDPTAPHEVAHEWNNVTVERVLYDTASFDVEYQIEVSDGVVHLYKPGNKSSLRNPLNIKVPLFAVEGEYSRIAMFDLKDKINLIMFPKPERTPNACAGSYGVSADETKVTLAMSDASAREILDALLTKSRSMMWLVILDSQQSEKGFFKTKPLRGDTTEKEQPEITLISRYHDPTTGKYRGDWKIGLTRP